MSKYTNATNTRRESRTLAGRFRGGRLNPVCAVAFRESESAILSQTITYELDPIAGRMITPITAELVSVYVPVQAIDVVANPAEAYAGNTEVVRDKLLSGTALFGLENENEITKRLGVVPRSVGGQKKVSLAVRYAHIAAVNYLRQRKYVKATQMDNTDISVSPALIGQTVLDRMNGVLDPEDRVNGAVNLNLPNVLLPVQGMGRLSNGATNITANRSVAQADGEGGVEVLNYPYSKEFQNNPSQMVQRTTGQGVPILEAVFNGIDAGSVSLTDFYNAELQDGLTRQMRQIIDDNPEYGEEMVTRWAHGLSVDSGKTPFIINQQTVTFGQNYRRATDGANLDMAQTDMATQIEFTVPVPATELGGVVITFAVVKPDETLASQPHPFLSEPWGATNYVSDEMARDPVPVTIRELDADCETADEETRAFYVGHNHLKKAYVNYGFNRHLDRTTVDAKTAIWQLEVPLSVTPESVLYPAELDHYPFADQQAEICTYTVSSVATVRTPMIFGPTPVEELAQIETDNLFEDQTEE